MKGCTTGSESGNGSCVRNFRREWAKRVLRLLPIRLRSFVAAGSDAQTSPSAYRHPGLDPTGVTKVVAETDTI